jgi:hypothetical protein
VPFWNSTPPPPPDTSFPGCSPLSCGLQEASGFSRGRSCSTPFDSSRLTTSMVVGQHRPTKKFTKSPGPVQRRRHQPQSHRPQNQSHPNKNQPQNHRRPGSPHSKKLQTLSPKNQSKSPLDSLQSTALSHFGTTHPPPPLDPSSQRCSPVSCRPRGVFRLIH